MQSRQQSLSILKSLSLYTKEARLPQHFALRDDRRKRKHPTLTPRGRREMKNSQELLVSVIPEIFNRVASTKIKVKWHLCFT